MSGCAHSLPEGETLPERAEVLAGAAASSSHPIRLK